MNAEWVKEYFKFTRKERIGIICLSLIVLGFAWLPQFFKSKTINDPQTLRIFDSVASILSARQNDEPKITDPESEERPEKYRPETTPHSSVALFNFDPNTLDEQGWRKLGLKDKTISTIKKYLSKGGSFKTASDIHKIYGINPALANKLEPFVRIESKATNPQPSKPEMAIKPIPKSIVDINQSDTAAWIALPGIWPALARRIVLFREKLGGFHSIDQIAETYGLADSVFQQIKPRLKLGADQVRKININTLDASQLKLHPYIGWKLANALVKYREAHGLYKTPQDLSQIDLFTPTILSKLIPYLSVE